MQKARGVAWWLGLTTLIVLPQFYQPSKAVQWSFPIVAHGDEPHYLVLLNSLIFDGDFDLRNNYLSVHEGSIQPGVAHPRPTLYPPHPHLICPHPLVLPPPFHP